MKKYIKLLIFIISTLLLISNIVYAYFSSLNSIEEIQFNDTTETTYLYAKEHIFNANFYDNIFSPYTTFKQINSKGNTICSKNAILPTMDLSISQNIYEPNIIYINTDYYLPMSTNKYPYFLSGILTYNLDTSEFNRIDIPIDTSKEVIDPMFSPYGSTDLTFVYNFTNHSDSYLINIKTGETFDLNLKDEHILSGYGPIFETNDYIYFSLGNLQVAKYSKNDSSYVQIEPFNDTRTTNPYFNLVGDYNGIPIVDQFALGTLYKIDENNQLIPFCDFSSLDYDTGYLDSNTIEEILYLNKREILAFVDKSDKYHLYKVDLENGEKTEVMEEHLSENSYYYPAYTYNENVYIEEINLNTNSKNILVFDSSTFKYKDTIFIDDYNPKKEVPSQFLFLEYNK